MMAKQAVRPFVHRALRCARWCAKHGAADEEIERGDERGTRLRKCWSKRRWQLRG
jgi:hypothetical protein